MDINGLVGLVSGGASGLGEAVVRTFVENGGKAAILDMDTEKGEALVKELGDAVIFCKTDVTNDGEVAAAVEKACDAFGGVHAAVSCAGVATPGKILGKKGILPLEKFARVIDINLTGTVNLIRYAADKMMANSPNEDGEKGVVINTASVAAFDGQIGQAAYAASKAGVVGMTLPIAREFADYGIRVMTIAPGIFGTPMMKGLPEKAQAALAEMMPFPKRLGYPHEFARLVKDIVENPMLNGETIRLDAALRMSAK